MPRSLQKRPQVQATPGPFFGHSYPSFSKACFATNGPLLGEILAIITYFFRFSVAMLSS